MLKNVLQNIFSFCVKIRFFQTHLTGGYTAPVDHLVHRVHQVPARHLFLTHDGVAAMDTAPQAHGGMSHYSDIMAAARLSDGGFIAIMCAAPSDRYAVYYCDAGGIFFKVQENQNKF